ncbi:MAG: cytochrome c3 family protein [Nitrospirae bacterium]|nr:cytochrome c3 family protein [Nitrospirota bacterium]
MSLLCLFSVFIAGCDKYTNYKILTFFFTGVPPLAGKEEPVETGGSITKAEQLKKRKDKRDIPSYAHGPYGASQCNQCHSTSSTATFSRKLDTPDKNIPSVAALDTVSRLILPVKELCIDCHTSKSVSAAFNLGLWVHGPVSEGICTACHNPHQSLYPYLLLKGNSKDMCTKCHIKGFIMDTEEHRKDEDCTSCHNPHVGMNRFLLKKDYDEAF